MNMVLAFPLGLLHNSMYIRGFLLEMVFLAKSQLNGLKIRLLRNVFSLQVLEYA
jgi:hypothetical protein